MSIPYATARAILGLVLLVFSLSASAQQFQPEISAYLQGHKQNWQLTDEDIRNWIISDQYTNRETGVTYTYLHQQISTVRIFNAVSTMAIRDGQVFYFSNRFHPKAAQKANSATPALEATAAIKAAAAHLGLPLTETPTLLSEERGRHRFTFSDGGISERPIRVELVYVPAGDNFVLAWDVNIALQKSPDWWNIRIDAHTGAFVDKNNWNVRCDFGHSHTDGAPCKGTTLPEASPAASTTGSAAAGGYKVFALPIEAPNFGVRSLVSDPEFLVASPFGWHDTDGAAGAEYTITRGNNVYAYEDKNDTNQPGYSPDGGAGLQFDFPLDLTQSPESNQDAIITNLFYLNNMLHDILYRHGFDEESGNFQENNYGNGGAGNDYVLAEAQDGGGANNANFSTPDDGSNGRMQMYLWPAGAVSLMRVHTPTDIAGDYTAVEASFGPGLTAPITSNVVLFEDPTAPVTDACEPAVNGSEIAGKIVVIDRGSCPFVNKVGFAEAAGAIAVIVVNNSAGTPTAMGGSGTFNIPSVMISQNDGNLLKAKLNASETVNVTLSPDQAASADRDGSLDNGIIAHEYGHGLSNRLTGGPSNSGCLGNGEQGGEGWSDWLALILTIEPGDAGANARGIGTYATADITGTGIRRFPYSTNMSINAQTYGSLATSSGVHAIGEIWSQVLWDMTWNLIDAEGFDPDWYNGNGGNNTALRLVIEGMKLQPCGPGYLDARDAILAADKLLYDNAHKCLIWKAFAGRGMGANAVQGSAGVAGDESEDFSIPTFCQVAIVPPVAGFTVDVNTTCIGTFKFTDQSTDIPQEWLWDFGDGNTSTAANPVHTYAIPGMYTVTLTVFNTLGMDDFSLTVNYETLAAPAVSADTTVCIGNPVTLTAAVDPGNTARWSTGGGVVFTGTTFNIPALQTSTTYTVQQLEDKPIGKVGPANNTFGGGGNHNTGFDGRVLFEAYKPFRLLSVLLYAQGAGMRTISLYDANNALVQAVTVMVPNGASRVTLNMDIPSAGLYGLGNVSQNLYRNNSGAAYPYILDTLVRIYSSNATAGTEQNFYYYFYDWEIQEASCPGASASVTVDVTPGPTADYTTTVAGGLTLNFVDLSLGGITSWSWNFGDGSPVVTEQNPTHTFPAAGTYTVALTVSDGICSHTYTRMQTLTTTGLHSPKDAFAINVFPNPADDVLNVEIFEALTGRIRLEMTDAAGRLVLSENVAPLSTQISVNTSNLAAGVYQLRITGNEGAAVRKVTILD